MRCVSCCGAANLVFLFLLAFALKNTDPEHSLLSRFGVAGAADHRRAGVFARRVASGGLSLGGILCVAANSPG